VGFVARQFDHRRFLPSPPIPCTGDLGEPRNPGQLKGGWNPINRPGSATVRWLVHAAQYQDGDWQSAAKASGSGPRAEGALCHPRGNIVATGWNKGQLRQRKADNGCPSKLL
jgi:hypothetical protein